eukprot:1976926-Prorocentrum_lima.AAC.1
MRIRRRCRVSWSGCSLWSMWSHRACMCRYCFLLPVVPSVVLALLLPPFCVVGSVAGLGARLSLRLPLARVV